MRAATSDSISRFAAVADLVQGVCAASASLMNVLLAMRLPALSRWRFGVVKYCVDRLTFGWHTLDAHVRT